MFNPLCTHGFGSRSKYFQVLAVLAFLATPFAEARSDHNPLPNVPPELKKVQAALAKYQDPVVAVREGFFSALGCVYFAEGAMGVHLINLRNVGPKPDPMKPQVLVYEPDDNGKLHLVSVEWLVPLFTKIKDRPTLFGQPFHGPMEGHYPYQPKGLHHYDFHVWLFKENPAGLFAQTNPNVNCVGKPYAHKSEHPKMVPHK